MKPFCDTIAFRISTLMLGFALLSSSGLADEPLLKVAPFQIDVTPPLGSPLCYGDVKPAREIVTPLTARGLILLGAGQPIVLCAVDWVGIGGESYDLFRETIAETVKTSPDRVALHTLHQHDAPGSDFDVERLATAHGLGGIRSNEAFDRDTMRRLALEAQSALSRAQPVTQVGFGSAVVEKVASSRRVLGENGKVAIVRFSSSRDPAAQAAPEGTIDPLVRLVAFWNGEQPVAVMTYYATHPQSYYGQGFVNWDFVGMARELREQALPGVPHIHFNGAGGNVTAGKYNDGSPDKRPLLAGRLADGMKRAWESQQKQPLKAADVSWSVRPVHLPPRATLNEKELTSRLNDTNATTSSRLWAARGLSFLQRMQNEHSIPVTCLRLNDARLLHLPGELFVEYQLAAQKLLPENFIAMAAYGDLSPGYIGTTLSYSQGGYETGWVSRVDPSVEKVLMDAIRSLLESSP